MDASHIEGEVHIERFSPALVELADICNPGVVPVSAGELCIEVELVCPPLILFIVF